MATLPVDGPNSHRRLQDIDTGDVAAHILSDGEGRRIVLWAIDAQAGVMRSCTPSNTLLVFDRFCSATMAPAFVLTDIAMGANSFGRHGGGAHQTRALRFPTQRNSCVNVKGPKSRGFR